MIEESIFPHFTYSTRAAASELLPFVAAFRGVTLEAIDDVVQNSKKRVAYRNQLKSVLLVTDVIAIPVILVNLLTMLFLAIKVIAFLSCLLFKNSTQKRKSECILQRRGS